MTPFQHQRAQVVAAFEQRNPRVAYQLLVASQYTAVTNTDLHIVALTAASLAEDWLSCYGSIELDGISEIAFLEVADDTYCLLATLWQDAAREDVARSGSDHGSSALHS